jgi:cell division protein FtsX
LLLRRDGWLTIALAAALTISLIVFAGFLWLRHSHPKNGRSAWAPTAERTLEIPDEATYLWIPKTGR